MITYLRCGLGSLILAFPTMQGPTAVAAQMDDAATLATLLIFCPILGLITGLIAKKKGLPFGWWWTFGALFFLAALPMVMLTPGEKEYYKRMFKKLHD